MVIREIGPSTAEMSTGKAKINVVCHGIQKRTAKGVDARIRISSRVGEGGRGKGHPWSRLYDQAHAEPDPWDSES